MLDELEALIGHVYVVGGRAVTTTPPGAIVELPPRKPQRGREQDTFFALVTPAGNLTGQAAFYEQLAHLAADLYFRTSGGVTSGLREAIGVVNNNLIEHNVVAGQRYEANMICMVLRGHEVYVARAGSCLCLLKQGELFTTLPDDLRDEYAVNGLPLGYSPVADIKLSHHEVAPGHVMVLSDAGFAQSERSDLRAALATGTIQSIIDPLKTLGGGKVQAIVVEFVSTDTPDPIAPTAATPLKIMRSSAAPAAIPAAPLSATGEAMIAPSPEVHPAPIIDDNEPVVQPRKSQPVTRPQPAIKTASTPIAKPISKPATSRTTAEPIPPVRELAAETGRNATIAGRKAVGGAASFMSIFTAALAGLFDRLLPEPEEGGPQVPAMLAAGLAILVPVIIVFIVVAVRLTQVDMSEFETMVQDVQTAENQAKLIPVNDVERSKKAWLGVIQRIENVEVTTGRVDSIELQRIRNEAQGILDTYARVTRRDVTHLRSFNEGAVLRGPALQGTSGVYTLDIKHNAIYRDTLNEILNTIAIRGNQPIVQEGQAVGTHSVKKLIDLIWMPEGGIPRANSLGALDAQGILITYSPTFSPATSQTLPGADLWKKPIALAMWRTKLYILDVGSNQIWRYVAGGSDYPSPPEEYFPHEFPVDLSGAVDFGISTSGDVFVLFADGTLRRFNGGQEEPFSYNGLPDGKLQSANSMYLDNDSTFPAIYITDPVDKSIYKITFSGTFNARYRATDDHAFEQLTGVYVNQERVYVASGSSIYTFTMSDTALTPTP